MHIRAVIFDKYQVWTDIEYQAKTLTEIQPQMYYLTRGDRTYPLFETGYQLN